MEKAVDLGVNADDIAIGSLDYHYVNPDSKEFDPEAVAAHVVETQGVSEKDHLEYIQLLRDTIDEHALDPNFPADLLLQARALVNDDTAELDVTQLRKLVTEIEREKQLLLNDSPYAEVRAVVSPTDDPALPCNTFRVWVLGTFFTIIGTGLDQFFSLRQPGIYVATSLAQLLSYPVAVAMAQYLPTKRIGFGRFSFTMNPGPFNQKEHILITVMSNVAYGGANGTAYVTYIFQVLKLDLFFGDKKLADNAGFQIMLALSTQLLGYGCAGLARRFLVYPAAMIWPRSLAQIALNKALHHDEGRQSVSGWTISRYRFFLYAFCGMFVYFWFPDYIFQAMSYFNWITWISPNNVTLALVTGSICGLGLNPWPTFDWNVVSYLVDPIITPWFSTLNIGVGMALFGFFIVPLVYWYNVFDTAYIPINSNHVFDNTGARYNVSRVLLPDFTLNVAAYESYSIPYLSATNSILYSSFFGLYLALVTYVLLYHWHELKTGFVAVIRWKDARADHKDVHNRLMRAYKEVPEWWYASILAISFILACVTCKIYDTDMPVWGIIFAVALCIVAQIPIGIVTAVTNMEVTNNVLAEYIGGLALVGKPIANMIFKTYGYIASAQSIQFASDLKLGHYLKVSPRLMFAAQVYATILGALVSIGVNDWQLSNIKDICQTDQSAKFTCPGSNTFFTAAVIWGVIGPKRMYGSGGLYNPLEWGFLAGALIPIPFYFATKRYPNSFLRYVHIPLLIYGGLNWAPYNFSYMWPALMAGWVFNYYIRRRYLGWWQKYAYVLTTSFAAAIALSGVVIFFAVEYHAVNINWWGNTVSYAGVDGGGSLTESCVLRTPPADTGVFAPH